MNDRNYCTWINSGGLDSSRYNRNGKDSHDDCESFSRNNGSHWNNDAKFSVGTKISFE